MRFLHLEIPGHALQALEQFYGETLGLPVQNREGGLEVTVGWSTLTFTPASRPAGHVEHLAFLLPMNHFEAAKHWLSNRVPLRHDLSGASDFRLSSWGSWYIYFDDPDGNILELIAYPDWPATNPNEFKPSKLLGLGEFGLAVTDVRATAAQLGPLTTDPPAPDDDSFMWVGGPSGRLILARTGRIWFPDTALPASPGPFRLTLDAGQVLTEAEIPSV